MVLLRISSESEKQIEEIAGFLLREKLAIDVNLKRNVERLNYIDGKIQMSKIQLLTAKTKAALFPQIDENLKDLCKPNMPEIYSLAIIHMDWEQSQQLKNDLKG